MKEEKSKLYLCVCPGRSKLYIIAKGPNQAKRLYFLNTKCRNREIKVSYVDYYIDADEPESIVYPNSTLAGSYGIEY